MEHTQVDQDLEKALEKSAEFGYRKLRGWEAYFVAFLAGAWSLFQLSLPQFLLLSSEYVRCIHLAFAITMVFFSFPMVRGSGWIPQLKKRGLGAFSFMAARQYIPISSWIFAILSAFCVLYFIIDYEGITNRQGVPLPRDIVIGVLLILLLLEAARRSIGPFLPLIALVFMVYSFFSEYMPAIFAFRNATLPKLINKITLSTEGIYGVPLDVSASTVFLFVLFGTILDKAGGGQYFIQLAFSLLGRFKGGPAKAAVLASGLTGIVSGSSIANTVTTGTFTIPLMKKMGYSAVKAGAIEVAASTNGQLMPPIMGAAAFIIAEYCNTSYFEVVRAAIVPSLAAYITLIYITHLEASKLGLKGLPKEDLPVFGKVFVNGIHFLIPLGLLLFEMMVLRHSPELSAYYAILSLCALVLIRGAWLGFREGASLRESMVSACRVIWEGMVAGARNMMGIGVAVACAGIVVGMVTMGIGNVLTDIIGVISGGNLVLLLVITAIASLILGMGLPTTANYIVMASLTVPVIVTLGAQSGVVIPVMAAHLFCFYFGILADTTPPVALAAYAASAISKADPIQTGIQGLLYDIRTALLPFIFIFNTDLLLINVHHPAHVLLVFVTTLIAMFAFASITQNFFVCRLRVYESLMLCACCLVILRPYLMQQWTGVPTLGWYALGTGLYVLVFLLQKARSESTQKPVPRRAKR